MPIREDAQPRGAIQVGRLGRVLDRVLDAHGRVRSGQAAERATQDVLRGARDLGSSERREFKDIVYGLARNRRRVDDVLERAVRATKRRLDTVDTPMRLRLEVLCYLALEGATEAELQALDPRAAKRFPNWLPKVLNNRLASAKRGPEEDLAIRTSMPSWIIERLWNAFGDERAALIAEGLQQRAPITLRVDPKLGREAVQKQLADLGIESSLTKLSPWGLVAEHPFDIKRLPAFEDGHVELQDEGSQMVVLAAGPKPGERILDACAGAGGKSLALYAATGDDKPTLVAFDVEKSKLNELERRAKRADAKIKVEQGRLETIGEKHHGKYDLVLVDAPCTGTGTIRRAPDLAFRIGPEDEQRHMDVQRRLLLGAFLATKPGGRLVYATCSVLPAENEGLSQYVAEAEPRLQPLSLSESWGSEMSHLLGATHEVRIGPGPDENGPDGFYVAQWRRTS